jgi:hypothetical protein
MSPVRLTRKEVAERRRENEERMEELVDTFRLLDIDPIAISSSDRSHILGEFLVWTELRRTRRVIGA